MSEAGKVKFFSDKGFGFITPGKFSVFLQWCGILQILNDVGEEGWGLSC